MLLFFKKFHGKRLNGFLELNFNQSMTKYICIGIINISQSMLMFTIVFGIQFYLFVWKSIDFFFYFKRQKLKTR